MAKIQRAQQDFGRDPRSRENGETPFADGDPLAELARIVGYETDKPDAGAMSDAKDDADDFDFDLEAELWRDLESSGGAIAEEPIVSAETGDLEINEIPAFLKPREAASDERTETLVMDERAQPPLEMEQSSDGGRDDAAMRHFETETPGEAEASALIGTDPAEDGTSIGDVGADDLPAAASAEDDGFDAELDRQSESAWSDDAIMRSHADIDEIDAADGLVPEEDAPQGAIAAADEARLPIHEEEPPAVAAFEDPAARHDEEAAAGAGAASSADDMAFDIEDELERAFMELETGVISSGAVAAGAGQATDGVRNDARMDAATLAADAAGQVGSADFGDAADLGAQEKHPAGDQSDIQKDSTEESRIKGLNETDAVSHEPYPDDVTLPGAALPREAPGVDHSVEPVARETAAAEHQASVSLERAPGEQTHAAMAIRDDVTSKDETGDAAASDSGFDFDFADFERDMSAAAHDPDEVLQPSNGFPAEPAVATGDGSNGVAAPIVDYQRIDEAAADRGTRPSSIEHDQPSAAFAADDDHPRPPDADLDDGSHADPASTSKPDFIAFADERTDPAGYEAAIPVSDPVVGPVAGPAAAPPLVFDPREMVALDDVIEPVVPVDVPEPVMQSDIRSPANNEIFDFDDFESEFADILQQGGLTSSSAAPGAQTEQPAETGQAGSSHDNAPDDGGTSLPQTWQAPQPPSQDADDIEFSDFDFSSRDQTADSALLQGATPAAEPVQATRPAMRRYGPFVLVGVVAVAGGLSLFGWLWADSAVGAGDGDARIIAAIDEPIKIVPEDPGGRVVPNQDQAVYEQVQGGGGASEITLVSRAEEPVDVVQRTLDPQVLPLEGRGGSGIEPPQDPSTAQSDQGALQGEEDATRIAALDDGAASGGNRFDGTALNPEGRGGSALPVAARRVRTMVVMPDGTLVARETATEDEAVLTEDNETAARGEGGIPVPLARPSSPGAQPAGNDVEARLTPTPATTPDDAATPQESDNATLAAPVNVVRTTALTGQNDAAAPAVEQGPAGPAEQAAEGSQAAAFNNPGGYVVQIASQPTEASAQSTYESLARRYETVLAGRSHQIQSADIDGRGTFYRVRVAGGTREEATALCQRYQAAGGSCFVAR